MAANLTMGNLTNLTMAANLTDNATSSEDGIATMNETISPTPTPFDTNAEEEAHEEDAINVLAINLTLIVCVLLAYAIKEYKIYYLPESAAAMLVGVAIGGIIAAINWKSNVVNAAMWQFKPELFFFIFLPPIIFEAGYSLKRKNFFDNIGAITLYACFGTVISTFIVGYSTFYFARWGIIDGIDTENPMEPLLFGALISAVDPVATLSIMGNPELQCDQLLYSLVFGESVLNDAVAIVLFKTFLVYYDPKAPDFSESDIPKAILDFVTMTVVSILIGVGLGLLASFLYKHTSLSSSPKLETSLLFLSCYACFSFAEAVEMSGIMALFFNGLVLSYYNSYNLSHTAHVASEHIFQTLATVSETVVFLYMGLGVFTGKFVDWNVAFSFCALLSCLVARVANIYPLSFLANLCRRRGRNNIPYKMQFVLWFAGLRGAIAFALAENMPGPNRETYATTTLTTCIFTTVVCGGFTQPILTCMGMQQGKSGVQSLNDDDDEDTEAEDGDFHHLVNAPIARKMSKSIYGGFKGIWRSIDNRYFKEWFGGPQQVVSGTEHPTASASDNLGDYELSAQHPSRYDEDDDDDDVDDFDDDGHDSDQFLDNESGGKQNGSILRK